MCVSVFQSTEDELKLGTRRGKTCFKLFSNGVMNWWNPLPNAVVESLTSSTFKSKRDKLHWSTVYSV